MYDTDPKRLPEGFPAANRQDFDAPAPWWRRQYRELKKLFFGPQYGADPFGPVARTGMLERDRISILLVLVPYRR